MVDYFLRRPVLAAVCSLLIVLAGAICIPQLPVAQYPQLAPPQITVTATYTGASAEVVESAVTTPLEQAINGVEGMKYMTSTSTNNGVSRIVVTFDVARDPDLAAIDVQNRVQQATGRLPNEVKVTGLAVAKNSSSFVLAFALSAEHGEYDSVFLSNYADRYVVDALKRLDGVGEVELFGERKYSMRLWLDPARLAARRLTAGDVVRALEEQNVHVAAGQLGQQPAREGQAYQMSVRANGRLADTAEFDQIILRTGDDGALVHLRDVGHAELGAEDYSTIARIDGKPAVGIGVLQLSNANALDVGRKSKAALRELAKSFPPGLTYQVAFDTTPFVEDSVHEVLKTLVEAIVLVVAVIFLFLGSVRSTVIPAITIPVSLVGTFAFVRLLGFSINTLTLFGITLATGLVVDDAIVVIENVERFIREKRMSPREASGAAMKEVAGAVVATSLVLVAVFVPVAFFPGTTGRIYKQFSLTIALSVAISAFNALTLTPALCAILLRRHAVSHGFFARFERALETLRARYGRGTAAAIRARWITVGVFVAALGLTWFVNRRVPTAFVPQEDQGYFIVAVQAPDGSSVEYTSNVAKKAEKILLAQPETLDTFSMSGFSFAGTSANKGILFVPLKPYAERQGKQHSAQAVIDRVRGELMAIGEGFVMPFSPPAVQGVGSYGGFQCEVLDKGGMSLAELAKSTWGIVGKGNEDPSLKGLFTSYTANDPQLVVDVDREKVKALGVPLADVFATLQIFLGSQYVNDFDFSNRSYRVYVQADARFRAEPRQIGELYVRASSGAMIPLANLVHVHESTAPQMISHYDMYRSAEIVGSPAAGKSTGDAIARMQSIARDVLPNGAGIDWSGLSLDELEAGSQTVMLFACGLVVVFLVLAAQYESFALPLIVLLGVPVAILGGLAAQWARGLQNDVFCQVGLLMLIGLASKNAILIVEFANQLRARGCSVVEAAREAAETRMRPILMTSIAFVLGVLPLVVASGAGQESRHSLGTTVAGGMIVSTVLNLYIVPVLYVVVETARERLRAWLANRSTFARTELEIELPPVDPSPFASSSSAE